jgi:hypothetical protein
MLVPVPSTLTEALNSQPACVKIIGLDQTSTTVREVPYTEIYRESTGVRETPAQRLQRIADDGVSGAEWRPARL